jgi:hypothetical protein
MKHRWRSCVALMLILALPALAQRRADPREEGPGAERLGKVTAPIDRAQNVITINQLGQVATNMGQWHPYTGVYPRGRWPINTNHDQLYKMSLAVGIPYNVANARGNGTKEWDPLPGNHNRAVGKIAISTDKTTWPTNGSGTPYWPVRTADGRDSIVSQQDTYTVYRDLTNARPEKLNIQVTQTSYAWSTSKDQDYIIYKLDIVNDTTAAKDSLWFGLYYDFDAGGITNEYDDDVYVWDSTKQLTYCYDTQGTTAWEPGSQPFLLGLVFLETPMVGGKRMGITDWHYSSVFESAWGDNPVDDSVFFNWMSSAEVLRSNTNRPNLFHGPNRRIDDWRMEDTVNGQPGVDGLAASGPYHMDPGQKMTFIFAMVAQQTRAQLYATVDRVYQTYNNGFQLVPPPKPTLAYDAHERKVKLHWSNALDFSSIDPRTGRSSIREYRVYKTKDPNRDLWGPPVAIIPRDSTKLTVNPNAYQWQDSVGVQNFFYYSYSVTVLDVDSLESGKSFLPADKTANENTVEARPINQARTSLNDIRVVPNPYIISSAWERKRLGDPKLGEPIRDLAFTNLPALCTIRIYTLDGSLVKTIEHSSGQGTEFWDLRSFSNQLVATGVYFYHVTSEAGEKISKFAIVR